MVKEFKIIIDENEDEMMSVSISSTGWNSLELDGIRSRLPRLIEEAFSKDHAVEREEEPETRECYCGHTRECECGPLEDAPEPLDNEQVRAVMELAKKLKTKKNNEK